MSAVGSVSMISFGVAIRSDVQEAQRLTRNVEGRSDAIALTQRVAVLCSTADILTANRTQLQTLRDIIDPNGSKPDPEQEEALQEIDAAIRTIKIPDTSDLDCAATLHGTG
jgi:hypothetical protein